MEKTDEMLRHERAGVLADLKERRRTFFGGALAVVVVCLFLWPLGTLTALLYGGFAALLFAMTK